MVACNEGESDSPSILNTLDESFDTKGQVTTVMGDEQSKTQRILIDNQDRIYAIGWYGNSPDSLAVARYSIDGVLDTTYATDGKLITDFDGWKFKATDAEFDSSGKLIISGSGGDSLSVNNSISGSGFSIVAVNSDGSIDTSFDTDGLLTLDIGGTDKAFGIGILDLTDAIYVSGRSSQSGSDTVIIKLNADGTQTNVTCGTNGIASFDFLASATENIYDLVEIDDAVIVGGAVDDGTDVDFILARISSTGTEFPGFGSSGVTVLDFSDGEDWLEKLLITDSGASVIAVGLSTLAGTSGESIAHNLVLAKFNVTDGSVDTSFGTDGKVSFDFQYSGEISQNQKTIDAVVDANGKILVTGANNLDNFGSMVVVRFNADGSVDSNFGDNGVLGVPMEIEAGVPRAIALQSTGRIILGGEKGANLDRHFNLGRFIP